ncbi:hypothetical protein KSP39_PZI024103 [Platanthera zijinensis]|uniref:Uncharacterized protein n=1 Tax=Platanthera zijinensis TaxID=2320716 RepID=A0AAP0AT10_9ASPA
MAKRSTRTAEGSALGEHTEPARSHSLVDVPLTAEAALAPVVALEGRVRQMEEQQTEMLTLLRNLGAPPAPPRSPPPANHPPLFNPPRNQEDPVEQEGPEDHSDAASSAHPHLGRARADRPHDPVNDALIHPLLTRQEIREAVAEECRQAARRDFHPQRTLYQGSPLTQQILDHPIPPGFKLPSVETFDGTDDPLEHQDPPRRPRDHQNAPPAPEGGRQAVGNIETIAGSPILTSQILSVHSVKEVHEDKKRKQDTTISFGDEDLINVRIPHQDPLVISAGIGNPCYNVKRILVDNGSSVDVLFSTTLQNMNISRQQLTPAAGPIYGFDNHQVQVIGTVTLPVTLGEFPRQITHEAQFVVVDSSSAYNAIFGRPVQTTFKAIPSIPHLAMKFPTPGGIGVVRGNQEAARSCYSKQAQPTEPTTLNIDDFDLRDEAVLQRGKPTEGLIEVPLSSSKPDRTVQLGSLLQEHEREELAAYLRKNKDIFAWSPEDMPGIDPQIIRHSLSINPACKPVIQKKRNFAPERLQAIEEEVEKLLRAQFIREVGYPTWVANVVLVKKSSGKWRMCVDYTNLNQACPKDSFPLPRIDQLVDSTAGHQLLSFMDAYSGYNQIRMNPTDEEHTAFRTDKGIYCYRVMPFGLKNAGATYQRLMNKIFKELIGRSMEVYVDDMLVKSIRRESHLEDLEKCFKILRQYGMKLNPSKCAFGVTSGKFLGFMVTQRGIEANPEKIKALEEMSPPRSLKDVQRLNGRITALSRFLARTGDKYLPFFKILRGARNSGFQWTDECQSAFKSLKQYLASPPLLSKPAPGEILFLYLAITPAALSSVLVKDEGGIQRPIYYLSKILSDTETRYPAADKTALALVFSARKLRPYFQAHTIKVLTELPLRAILQKPEASGRLVKWAVELGEFDIHFLPRPVIKSQVLADFIVENTLPMETEFAPSEAGRAWTLYVDGASGAEGAGAGLLLINPELVTLEYGLRLKFPATNNAAEYEALIAGLRLAISCQIQQLTVYSDSQLVVSQVEGEFEAKSEQLSQYLKLVKSLIIQIPQIQIVHIPREQNNKADALSKLATSSTQYQSRRRQVEEIVFPSIHGPWEVAEVNKAEESWIAPLIAHLKGQLSPEDQKEARRLRIRAAAFTLIDGELYKRSFAGPYLKCLSGEDAEYTLREVHQGVCGEHLGGKALARKILRQGFYWPTMKKEATEFVQKCKSCQVHANIPRQPPVALTSIQGAWPFAQWGIDLLGPLPLASGQRKFIIMAIDYFTKWIEAEPLAKITEENAKQFVWKNIVCRFGIPAVIITDNGTQFTGKSFTKLCEDLKITLRHTAVSHPQSNGQIEVTNRTILKGLKTRLEDAGGQWVDALPNVLWAYRTTERTPTGETPYNLCYGTEAIIPVDIGVPSPRTSNFDPQINSEALRDNLDLIFEVREEAALRAAAYQQRTARYYNRRVKARSINIGDLVLRTLEAAGKGTQGDKLSPTWEGPFVVTAMACPPHEKAAGLSRAKSRGPVPRNTVGACPPHEEAAGLSRAKSRGPVPRNTVGACPPHEEAAGLSRAKSRGPVPRNTVGACPPHEEAAGLSRAKSRGPVPRNTVGACPPHEEAAGLSRAKSRGPVPRNTVGACPPHEEAAGLSRAKNRGPVPRNTVGACPPHEEAAGLSRAKSRGPVPRNTVGACPPHKEAAGLSRAKGRGPAPRNTMRTRPPHKQALIRTRPRVRPTH